MVDVRDEQPTIILLVNIFPGNRDNSITCINTIYLDDCSCFVVVQLTLESFIFYDFFVYAGGSKNLLPFQTILKLLMHFMSSSIISTFSCYKNVPIVIHKYFFIVIVRPTLSQPPPSHTHLV